MPASLLLAFGPISERLGRRGAFALMQLAAIAIVPITCYLPQTYWQMLAILPIFGFFTGGIHAGYAPVCWGPAFVSAAAGAAGLKLS